MSNDIQKMVLSCTVKANSLAIECPTIGDIVINFAIASQIIRETERQKACLYGLINQYKHIDRAQEVIPRVTLDTKHTVYGQS